MTATTVVDAARGLASELSERALENEQRRTMAPDLIDKMRAAGLFHLGLPAELGGLECDPITILETWLIPLFSISRRRRDRSSALRSRPMRHRR
ncbi:MAG: indole-3-acetate monooxygenase [Ilumatobacteraceae bacterium]